MSIIKSRKLSQAVTRFTSAMRTRLAQKERKGFVDWDNKEEISNEELVHRASEKMVDMESLETSENAIDIANFMMMIWHRLNHEK